MPHGLTPRGARGRWRWTLPSALVVALAFIASAVAASAATELFESPAATVRHRHRSAPVAPAQVTITAHAAMTPVPRSFLGFSTEYWTLPEWASQMPLLERVLSLMHARSDGPLIIRVGGDSADHAFWDPPQELRLPQWAFTIEPSLLAQAGQLVRGLDARLLLDLNLITDSPAQAVQWAEAAQTALPRGIIVGYEIGNEPDVYTRHGWLAITDGRQYLGRPLPAALTAADYVRDFRRYALALRQVAPHLLLAGPALARPTAHADWAKALIDGASRSLGMVTVHRYPLSGCARHPSRAYPTVAKLLSPELSQGMAEALRPVIEAAHAAGLPLRMTELNSVNCGGRPGVSDTFATALWAPDALFSLLHAGVDSVNLHVRADTINAPFALNAGSLDARPLLYGLILFRDALGPRARLIIPAVHARRAVNLAAYGVRTAGNTLHVVLLDKGPRSVRIALRLPATADATVQRLIAPSPAARSGVTFAGRRLGRDGRWIGSAVDQVIARRGAVYTVELRRASAALVTVPVEHGALGVRSTGVQPPGGAGRAPRGARSRRH